MALLWHRQAGEVRYEVRCAGRTRRLYTNGVFHSQFNPARPVTGSVWDLLMLPVFFYPPAHVQRVLVLGVGGGAVIRQLQHFQCPAHITGVDLDPVHLQVARRFFGVGGGGVSLVQADAVEWVRARRGEPFDLVIDDLFGESAGEPRRAVAADARWCRALSRLLKPDGALVMNFDTGEGLRAAAPLQDAAIRARFRSGFRFSTTHEHNAVGAFLGIGADSTSLRRRLVETPGLNPRNRTSRLDYRVRRLF